MKMSRVLAALASLGAAGALVASSTALASADVVFENYPSAKTLSLGQTATFDHFIVTVSGVDELAGYGQAAEITTCITSHPYGGSNKVRLSWEPWSAATKSGLVAAGMGHEGMNEWSPSYPYDNHYPTGSCVVGWLPFHSADGTNLTFIKYANSLGDRATWKVNSWSQAEDDHRGCGQEID